MFDIATVGTALESIKTATDLLKGLRATKAIMDNADVQLKISDLAMALAEANVALAGVKTQLIEKEETINLLQKKLKIEVNTFYEEPFYWSNNDEKKDGPFCQRCKDSDNKLIRVIYKRTTRGTYHCTVCGEWYGQGLKAKPVRVKGAWF